MTETRCNRREPHPLSECANYPQFAELALGPRDMVAHYDAPAPAEPDLRQAEADDIALALEMRAEGASLYGIHNATGRSKEWLRAHGIN